jgi:hypothetical protein
MSETTEPETFEEWRVTGQPDSHYPPYDFTLSPDANPHLGDPETQARRFIAVLQEVGAVWTDGPHLHSRTVTRTAWLQHDTTTSDRLQHAGPDACRAQRLDDQQQASDHRD